MRGGSDFLRASSEFLRRAVRSSLYTFPNGSKSPVWGSAQRVTDSWSAGFACKRKQSLHSRYASIHNNVHRLAGGAETTREFLLESFSRLCIAMSATHGNEEKCGEAS